MKGVSESRARPPRRLREARLWGLGGIVTVAAIGIAGCAMPTETSATGGDKHEEGRVGECERTEPMTASELGRQPGASSAEVRVNYGKDDLWVMLPPPDLAPIKSGSTYSVKVPWWRSVPGDLQMSARRLDGPGTADAEIPSGYGKQGFQVSGLMLSDLGCWEVTGVLGDSVVTFVIDVANPVEAEY
jgi:hypothetical protein